MSFDNFLGWEIVLKISLSLEASLLGRMLICGQSLSRGPYQETFQPPEGVYSTIISWVRVDMRWSKASEAFNAELALANLVSIQRE